MSNQLAADKCSMSKGVGLTNIHSTPQLRGLCQVGAKAGVPDESPNYILYVSFIGRKALESDEKGLRNF